MHIIELIKQLSRFNNTNTSTNTSTINSNLDSDTSDSSSDGNSISVDYNRICLTISQISTI